jgi:hypothetical protein
VGGGDEGLAVGEDEGGGDPDDVEGWKSGGSSPMKKVKPR